MRRRRRIMKKNKTMNVEMTEQEKESFEKYKARMEKLSVDRKRNRLVDKAIIEVAKGRGITAEDSDVQKMVDKLLAEKQNNNC